jgi:DDE superfamily endonuclease
LTYSINTSDRGWTDGNIGRNWLEQIFDHETKEKARGKPRVLLLDGHSSHYTLAFIDYAQANNIILLGYPAHCTHALQGLDVVCFAKMKEAWKQEIVTFEDEKMWKVSKSEFTFLWSRAVRLELCFE